jgi:hypothetical protein
VGKSIAARSLENAAADRPDAPHFSGKRKSERYVADLAVELRGGGVVLPGRAVDLSEDGVRVRMSESVLRTISQTTDAVAFYEAVDHHFARGLEVWFPGHGLRVQASVVRLVTRPMGGSEAFIGCEFTKPLSAAEWTKIRP